MGFTLVLPLRIAQFCFAWVIMGLAIYVFHWYESATLSDPPKQINYLIAIPVFTILSILYLEITPRFLPKFSFSVVHVALEVLNTIFYFCGFVAMASFLSKLIFCRGKVCAAARTDTIFASFSFLLWGGTTIIMGLELWKGGIEGVRTDRMATKAMGEQKKHAAEMGANVV